MPRPHLTIPPPCEPASSGRGDRGRVPADSPWRLDRFEAELDAWADREDVPADVLLPILAWIVSRMDDPYLGVARAEGFENLWHGLVPGTSGLIEGREVACSYWIEERTHTVRCDNFGLR